MALRDYDGDNDQDLIVGAGDWTDYGWDHAYDANGRWMNGPLHGFVYCIENTGSDAEPHYSTILKGSRPARRILMSMDGHRQTLLTLIKMVFRSDLVSSSMVLPISKMGIKNISTILHCIKLTADDGVWADDRHSS